RTGSSGATSRSSDVVRSERRGTTQIACRSQRRRPIPKRGAMNQQTVIELLLQSLEHERGGIKVYETSLTCIQNDDLKEEFGKYLDETRNHEQILLGVCDALEIDPEAKIPGREVISTVGNALVEAMKKAKAAGNPDAAEIVACECVVL